MPFGLSGSRLLADMFVLKSLHPWATVSSTPISALQFSHTIVSGSGLESLSAFSRSA